MTTQTLDLETYFEQDILEFLDKKKQEQEAEAQGSTSEMLSALENNNVAEAVKLIEDAISQYNNYSMHEAYKEIYYKKILEMMRQAIDFINLHPQQSKLRETIELLIQSGELSQGAIEKITVLEKRDNAIEEEKMTAKEEEQNYLNKILEKIKDISGLISLNIRRKDLRSSVYYYKELKSYFEQYPSSDMERKQEIYNDLLSFFMQINKLKKELDEERLKASNDKKRLELSSKSNANKYLRLSELNDIISQIKEDVKKSDFTSASQKIIELRQITSKIPDQYKHIRSILNSKIDVIMQRVEFVKRIRTHN